MVLPHAVKLYGARVFVMLALAGVASGCDSRPPPVLVPSYDPDGVARRALDFYDKNRDGKLDVSELARCPSLKHGLPQLDKDKHGYLTAEDIADRIRGFQTGGIGVMATRCRVVRDGQGVQGVTVTFIPEDFMGDSVKAGTGVSDADGWVALQVPDKGAPGLSLGYYRVEVSLKDAGGKETLPARFNTNTVYGYEIAPTRSGSVITIKLAP